MSDPHIKYEHSTDVHNTRAAEIVVPHILRMFPVRSVLDVGCGLGTWLEVFQNKGLSDFLGIDGSNVNRSLLRISGERFRVHDLRTPFDLERKFDLVLCLEVAEHLPEGCAREFVTSLCRHSDHIVFSAAIPGQGGQHHINERWPDFWRLLFKDNGYRLLDAIRPLIWNEQKIDVWYRQNLFIYVKETDPAVGAAHTMQMAEIHPELWKMKVETIARLAEEVNGFDKGDAGIRRSFKALLNAVRNKISGR